MEAVAPKPQGHASKPLSFRCSHGAQNRPGLRASPRAAIHKADGDPAIEDGPPEALCPKPTWAPGRGSFCLVLVY